jgi:hypothetical protein
MAIDLVGLLTGNNSLENQYQANDPWYQAARGIGGLQLAPATNNTEAFLLPFLQGATAGGLAGYGRHNAQETAYKDISSALNNIGYKPSPIADALAADQIQYGLDEMPENFSIKASTPDLLLALSQQSAKQEAAAKKAEALALLNPEIAAAKASFEKHVAQGTAEGKRAGEGGSANIPAAIMGEVADQAGIVQEARAIGAELKTSGKSWSDIQSAGMFAGLDEDGAAARVADLADRVMRSRTGATAPPAEAAAIRKFIAGDRTVGPQQMANLLEKFAEREAANAKAKLKVASSPDPSALFDTPTSQTVKAPISAAAAQAELRRRGLIK